MELINEDQLIKLLNILRDKNVDVKIILNICKISKFSEMNTLQFNNLLYLLLFVK